MIHVLIFGILYVDVFKDMTQPTPTQELVAKDLHGYEWRFKHIFRGKGFYLLASLSFLEILMCFFEVPIHGYG